MGVESDMKLHTEIFRQGRRQTYDVDVKLDRDWFRVEKSLKKMPKPITVRRYWDLIKQPTESTTAFQQLYMIKRAMLDWPVMGAAISKLAQEEFKISMIALKRLKKQTIAHNKKIVKNKLDKAADIIKEKSLGKPIKSNKKTDGKAENKLKQPAKR
jgi:hypothetical protein